MPPAEDSTGRPAQWDVLLKPFVITEGDFPLVPQAVCMALLGLTQTLGWALPMPPISQRDRLKPREIGPRRREEGRNKKKEQMGKE